MRAFDGYMFHPLGDLTQLQTAAARFVAASKVYLRHPLDPRWMLSLLTDLEHAWQTDTLTREEEMWLAERFASMLGINHMKPFSHMFYKPKLQKDGYNNSDTTDNYFPPYTRNR